jgi:hypothetical protein
LRQRKSYVPKLGEFSKKKKGHVICANQVGLSRRGPVWRPLSRRHLGPYKNSRMGLRGSLAIQLYPSIQRSIIRIRQSLIEALLYETHEDDGESKGLLLAGTA